MGWNDATFWSFGRVMVIGEVKTVKFVLVGRFHRLGI